MRRWVWRVLLIVAVMAALTVGAAAEEVTLGGIRYNGNEVVGPVESNRPSIATAKIAAEVNGVAITKIGDHAFDGCGQLKTVEIPETITSIGEYAFTGCGLLSDVRFSDKITTIGTYAFASCTALKSIALPPSAGVIENLTFLGCTGLQNVYFPSAGVTIRAQAFEGCTNLKILHYNSLSGTTPPTQEAPVDKQLEFHAAAPLPVTSKPATCKEEGAQKVTVHCYDAKCNKDIYAESRVLPKTDHKPEDIIEVERVEPTCTKPGAEAGKRCKLCGKTVEGLTVIEKDENAHTVVAIPAVRPTCTSGGKTAGERCSTCGKVITEPQEEQAKGHDYTNAETVTEPVKPATCEEDGLTVKYRKCNTCKEVEVCDTCKELKADPEKETDYEAHLEAEHTTEVIPAPGHTPGESKYIVTKPAACETEGEETWKVACSVCGEECGDDPTGELDHPARPIPALGHDLAGGIETITQQPTCTEPGEKTVSAQACKRDSCDYKQEEQTGVEVAPLGHNLTAPVDKKDVVSATCEEDGEDWLDFRECTREGCDYEEKTIVTKRGAHTWANPQPDDSQEDVPATCGKEGESHVIATCSVCGKTEARTIKLPATGLHNWSEWEITEPTETQPGEKKRVCDTCEEEDIVVLPATGDPSGPDDTDDPDGPDKPEPAYLVNLVQGAGGSVSSNKSSAKSGDRVTLTIWAESGYELDMIRVVSASGGVPSVTDLGGNQHRFTMPASNVEVRVTFVRKSAGSAWSSSWASAPGDGADGNPRRTTDPMPTQSPAQSVPRAGVSDQLFRDIPASHWAAGEISWANQMGYMNGSGGRFNPDGTITHQQMWMVLARITGSRPANMTEARRWAVENSFADGSSPTGAVARHQLVTALYRCAHLVGSTNRNTTSLAGYTDSRTVPTVARDAFSWAVANGIVGGTANGRLDPNGTLTRAQFAVILYRYSQRI